MQIYNLHDLDSGFLRESDWNNIYQVRAQRDGAIRIPLPAKNRRTRIELAGGGTVRPLQTCVDRSCLLLQIRIFGVYNLSGIIQQEGNTSRARAGTGPN